MTSFLPKDLLKIATINAKNSTAINSSLGTSVGHRNKERKMEVLKIEIKDGFLFLISPWTKIGSKI